jgi:hypothetical protein
MMRKIVVALAMVPMLARADLTPGTFEVQGNSNVLFNSGSEKVTGSETKDTMEYGLDVRGLYYAIPNLGVGLTLGYGNLSSKVAGFKSGSSSYVVGPAVAYEVPVAPQLAVFGFGDLGYVSETQTADGAADVKATGYEANLELGVKYFLVKNFSFNAGLGYSYTSVKDDATPQLTTTTRGFGLNVGLSVYFGGGAGP